MDKTDNKELVAFSENSTVLVWDNREISDYAAHWHTAMEIIIPIENSYDASVDETDFHLLPNDIFMIAPGQIHKLTAPDSGHRFIMLIDISFLANIKGFASIQAAYSPALHISPSSHPKTHHILLELFFEISNLYFEGKEYNELDIYTKLLNVFSIIGYDKTKNQSLFSDCRIDKKAEYIQKLNLVLDYIEKNYSEDITLKSSAELAGFSKYHFSRLFTHYTGYTFCNYLNNQRINAALSLLSNDTLAVTDIAMMCGFSSISTFNRLFRQLKKCSPSEYRNMNRH